MMKILIADDHSIVRLGLKLLVQEVLGNVHIDFVEDGDGVFKMRVNGHLWW
jgi:DNA-binding NarL/FixJ family response regulator